MKRLPTLLLDCISVMIVSVCIVGSAMTYVYFNPGPKVPAVQPVHIAPIKEPLMVVTNKGHRQIIKDY